MTDRKDLPPAAQRALAEAEERLVGLLHARERAGDIRVMPPGGLTLWCRLPEPVAVTVAAEAERLGVYVVPGVRFAVGGGMAHHVRLPYAGDPTTFPGAVERLRSAYDAALRAPSSLPTPRDPVTLGERDALIA